MYRSGSLSVMFQKLSSMVPLLWQASYSNHIVWSFAWNLSSLVMQQERCLLSKRLTGAIWFAGGSRWSWQCCESRAAEGNAAWIHQEEEPHCSLCNRATWAHRPRSASKAHVYYYGLLWGTLCSHASQLSSWRSVFRQLETSERLAASPQRLLVQLLPDIDTGTSI